MLNSWRWVYKALLISMRFCKTPLPVLTKHLLCPIRKDAISKQGKAMHLKKSNKVKTKPSDTQTISTLLRQVQIITMQVKTLWNFLSFILPRQYSTHSLFLLSATNIENFTNSLNVDTCGSSFADNGLLKNAVCILPGTSNVLCVC